MPSKIIFSKDQIKDIIQKYLKGLSTIKIGNDYNINNKTIGRLLKNNNIKVSNRKHFYNEKYFDKINTSDKAYWLGFILADGYVNEKKYFMRIKLQECDKYHLYKFIKCINGDKNMIHFEYHNITGNKEYYVEVNGKYFINSLIKLNIRQAKSSGKEKLSPIPKRYIKDYIRGIWDGDGHIENKKLDLISSIEVLSFVQEYLCKKCNSNINKICDHCNTYRIYVCKNRINVLKHLYYTNCLSLDRKYNIARNIIYNNKLKNNINKVNKYAV